MEISWNRATQENWQKNQPDSACALQHAWAYGAAIASMGGQVDRVRLTLSGGQIGFAQIVSKRVLGLGVVGLISRGPVWNKPVDRKTRREAYACLRQNLPGKGVRFLLATPEDDQTGLLPLYTPCHMAELDLSRDIAGMRAGLHGKWRNALEKAVGSKLRISISQDPDVLVGLIEKEDAQQRQNRYRNLPSRFLANWVRNDPNTFRVYRAMMGSEAVAEMLFLDHAPGVTYHIGWTSGAGRTFCAHNLLMWRAIKDFAGMGRKRLDLGTLDTVNTPGLARFKLGTGAKVRVLGTTGLVLPQFSKSRPHYAARITSTGTAL